MTLEPENTPMTDERKALVDTYFETFGQTPGFHAVYGEGEDKDRGFRFAKLVDCGAYLDAAMMLVPEGWHLSLDNIPGRDGHEGEFFCRIQSPDYDSVTWGKGECWIHDVLAGRDAKAFATTPALALLSAIREARKNDASAPQR